jgi:hypothetical protein
MGRTRKSRWASRAALLMVFLGGTSADAATIPAASCSQADVQAAVASAANGDTVSVPGPCTAAWTALAIANTKGITLAGGNGGTTTIDGSNALVVDANASTTTRVTGFAFTGMGTDNDGDVRFGGSTTTAPFRIDHCTFTNSAQSVFLVVGGETSGLVDHDTFTGGGASEEIHVTGTGPSDASSWSDDVIPGGPAMVFIEDDTFADTDTTFICSGIQSYYGARTVVRHNAFHFCQVDQHGTAGMIGARWWEIYENDFYPQGLNQCCYADIRAGSGVIFGNREQGSPMYPPAHITLREEDTGTWPLAYQIGSGIHGGTDGHNSCPGPLNSSPAYVWGNSATISVGSGSANVVQGRDVLASASQPATMLREELSTDMCSTTYAYVPYRYPHPLQGGDGGADGGSIDAGGDASAGGDAAIPADAGGGSDAGPTGEAGPTQPGSARTSGGCNCRETPSRGASSGWVLASALAVAGVAVRRRRRS